MRRSTRATARSAARRDGRAAAVTRLTIGLGALAVPPALDGEPVVAAELVAGGLDLTVAGFLRAEAFGGQLDDARQDESYGRGLDFRNDTEVHVLARAESRELGIDYGATIEFDADTDQTFNTKETWVFVRGDWGEIRMGDVEGVAEESSVGAQEVAAGTGGIDGAVIDEIAVPVVFLTNTDTATKLRYYTPDLAGFSAGLSYAPTLEIIDEGELNGQFVARKSGDDAMEAQNVVEAGLIYDGDLGELDVLASVVGIAGSLRNDAREEFGGSRWWGWQAGATLDLSGLQLGGSYGDESVGDTGRKFFTAGIGWDDEAWRASLTYGSGLRH